MTRAFLALILSVAVVPALAHTGETAGGFLAGVTHPVFGPDHVAGLGIDRLIADPVAGFPVDDVQANTA